MIHSVRWRLLFSTLLVSLVTILAVGVVTLLLLQTNFTRQERNYLGTQAQLFAPSITQAVADNSQPELQRTVAMISLASQMRVQVRDSADQLVADSGERDELAIFNPIAVERPQVIVGAVVDDSGHVISVSPPLSRQDSGSGRFALVFTEPSQLLGSSSFTAVSDTDLRIPITDGDRAIGYLDLSQGPAVGENVLLSIRLALIGGGLVALVMAAMVGLLSARQVTRPLASLGATAEAMGTGDLSARAPYSNLAEYDRLAVQFNTMADRLAATIERLEQERNTTQHMLANFSHEFRTPITSIKLFNTLLAEEVAPGTRAEELVSASEKVINRFHQVVNGVLDISRLDTRLSGADFVTVDLRETIEQAVQVIRPLAEEKTQQLTVDLPDDALFYSHDPMAIQQAVGNLLHNAVKYTQPGGQIGIELRASGDELQIVVWDNGVGIEDQERPYIFERFYQGTGHHHDGVGLGLAICHEIVNIHGGQITVDSTPGAGSTFTCSFHVAQ